jgi:hypothetical protein
MKLIISSAIAALLLGSWVAQGVCKAADVTVRPAIYTVSGAPGSAELSPADSSGPAVQTVGWRRYGYYRPYYGYHRPYSYGYYAPYYAYRPYYYRPYSYGYAAPYYGAYYGPYGTGYRGRGYW